MPPKAKPKAKAKAKAKAVAGRWRARVLPALPAALVPERWYSLPGGQSSLEQIRTGQLVQVDVEGGFMMLEVLGIHPRDPQGMYLEVAFRGGSSEAVQRWGDSAREQNRDLLLHLCCGTRRCQSDVAGRLIIHSRRFRVREQGGVTETWFEREPVALPGIERLEEPRDTPEEAVMSKVKALRDRVLSARGERTGMEALAPAEADAMLAEAEKALKSEERAAHAQKKNVGRELSARSRLQAQHSGSKRKRSRRRRRGSSSGSDSSSSSRGFRDSNKVARLCERHPGKLLKGTLQKMREYLSLREGGVGSAVTDPLSPIVTTYLTTALMPSLGDTLGLRNSRELLTLARSVDSILRGDTVGAAEILLQRFKAVEMSALEGSARGGFFWVGAATCPCFGEGGAEIQAEQRFDRTRATWREQSSWREKQPGCGQGVGLGTRPGKARRTFREATPPRQSAYWSEDCAEERSRGRAEHRAEPDEAADKESETEDEETSVAWRLREWLNKSGLTTNCIAGLTLAELGPRVLGLSEQMLALKLGPTQTNRDWRELLPLPRLPCIGEGEVTDNRWADVLGVQVAHVITRSESDQLCWALAIANGINLHYGKGWADGELTTGQWKCLGLLYRSSEYFCKLPQAVVPCEGWRELLHKKGVSYTGEVIDHGEVLDWARVVPGLPPYEHCAAVNSVALAEGEIREYLLHPELAVLDVTTLKARPRPGR
eukprot:4154664-Amphidinium_carterae.1